MLTPAWNNPLAQVAFVAFLGRVSLLVVIVHPHLSLAVMVNQQLEGTQNGTARFDDLPVYVRRTSIRCSAAAPQTHMLHAWRVDVHPGRQWHSDAPAYELKPLRRRH